MSKQHRVLIVDDEFQNRELMEGMVEVLGHDSALAGSGFEALQMAAKGFDLVLLDIMMPDMDGYEVAQRIRSNKKTANIPIIMVTALNSREDRLRAVEAGANDFIAKPVDITELRVRSESLLRMKDAQDAIQHYQEHLEETVRKRTLALHRTLEEITAAQQKTNRAYLDTIRRLAIAAEYKDQDTASHLRRISYICTILGRAIGLSEQENNVLRIASIMHDVGKIGIPDSVLLKPGKLAKNEWEIMKTHTTIGESILKGSPSKLLEAGRVIAVSHHEHWDGTGYPKGLHREGIPVSGRICAVADVFDALTNPRPYRKALSNDAALKIMKTGDGTYFDPYILAAFFKALPEIEKVQHRFRSKGKRRKVVS